MDHDQSKAHFLQIYDTYAADLYRFCAFKVSNRELAEDITQEAFMKYWQSLREQKIKNDRAFLYTVARNLIIDWYRRKKESSLDVLSDAGIEFESHDQTAITDTAEAREVLEVVQKLDEDSRDVFLLRFVEGFSPKEIATMRNESANAVSVRINRATKKVQELIHAKER
jgi:RNA polymerase sigma-70 factor (ECF subfamily)